MFQGKNLGGEVADVSGMGGRLGVGRYPRESKFVDLSVTIDYEVGQML